MIIQDDRTKEEKETHPYIVAMTDSFLSGCGKAENGVSYAGWACTWENLTQVEQWVRGRSDAKRVRVVGSDWRPRGKGHTHLCS